MGEGSGEDTLERHLSMELVDLESLMEGYKAKSCFVQDNDDFGFNHVEFEDLVEHAMKLRYPENNCH